MSRIRPIPYGTPEEDKERQYLDRAEIAESEHLSHVAAAFRRLAATKAAAREARDAEEGRKDE